MTQRRPNPYFVRASATSAQAMHGLADYAAKDLKYKTAITVSDDFAFGCEQMSGFQRVFEDAGGRVKAKLWPTLVTPDYTPYLAQIGAADAVVARFAGANPLKFMQQYRTAGLTLPLLGGEGIADDSLLRTFGDESVGLISSGPYSGVRLAGQPKICRWDGPETGKIPGIAAAYLYINGMVAGAALKATGGSSDDKEAFMKALRAVALTDSPRGAFHFDHFGNVVGNIFIHRGERKGDKLTNTVVKTYPGRTQQPSKLKPHS